MPALAQAVAQPNRPADVNDDQRLTHLAQHLAAKPPATQPASAAPSPRSSAAPPAATPAAVAPQVDPKESLALGPARKSAAPASGPLPGGDSNTTWMLSTLAALGAVVGLILLLRAGIAKMTGRSVASAHSPVIEVLSRTSIAPRNHVLLLRLGKRILAVGDSPSGLHTLADISEPEEVASLLQAISVAKPGSSSRGFSQLLQGFDGQYEQQPQDSHFGADTSEHQVDRARERVRGLLSRLRGTSKGGDA